MNDLLSEYEQQFGVITAEITTKTSTLLNRRLPNTSKIVQEIKCLLNDAMELLEHMELEVRDSPQDQREKLKTRVRSYEVELKRLEGEFRRAEKTAIPSEEELRSELFSENGESLKRPGEDQKQRLLNNTETLERTSTLLSQSYRAAIDSEHVGAQILNDLQYQRETLSRARQKLHDTDDDLNQSSRTLNTMVKRAMQNKFILGSVGVVVVVVIVLAIFLKSR